jgi:hypothetical protein
MPVYKWLVDGLSLKNVVVTVFIVVGLHYTQDSRITVVEQHEPEFARRLDDTQKAIDAQTADIKSKVDRDTYDADQRKLQDELSQIQESEGRIESILMDQKKH